MLTTQLTELGFKKKTFDEYLVELEKLARDLFGQDANLSINGPLGKFIRLQAFGRAEENELAEAVYLSAFVDHAEGISLDYAVKNSGLTRLQATKSLAYVDFKVTPGKTIDPGIIVSTKLGIQFVTIEGATDTGRIGVVRVQAEAMKAGRSGNVDANTITVIDTPVAGVESVNNPVATAKGRDLETDRELRARHVEVDANSLSSTINGIRKSLLDNVPDVASAIVIENDQPVVVNGRPPHSFEAIVYGGSSQDIAAAILNAKPAGIRSFGTQTVVLKDDSGQDQTIGFSYATGVNVWVKADITTDASFPVNGIDLVKTEVIKYIGGVDLDGKSYPGLGMGASVINMQTSLAIGREVPGVLDATITFSTNGTTYTGGNVAITASQVAQTALDKVSVI